MPRTRLLAIAALLAASSASAPAQEALNASAARSFVTGKIFSYQCMDGTNGVGRINNDGSVAGTIRVYGKDPARYIRLPVNSLFEKGGQICAQVKGLPFSPCFTLTKTSNTSFRGAVSGLGFMYCDFQRGGRPMVARKQRPPQAVQTSPAPASP